MGHNEMLISFGADPIEVKRRVPRLPVTIKMV
jgi:hypothetical protein